MNKRFADLYRAIVDALKEADALSELGTSPDEQVSMSDVGIGLDKARIALEHLVWPQSAKDHLPLQ